MDGPWTRTDDRQWVLQKNVFTQYVINQDEETYEYIFEVYQDKGETKEVRIFKQGGFKSKAKAVKFAESWKPEEKQLFDRSSYKDGQEVCGPDCECEKCSDEGSEEEVNVKITTTKTTRKEKLEEPEGTKSDLKLALWYIEKIGSTKRAKQVLNAACKAMDEIK